MSEVSRMFTLESAQDELLINLSSSAFTPVRDVSLEAKPFLTAEDVDELDIEEGTAVKGPEGFKLKIGEGEIGEKAISAAKAIANTLMARRNVGTAVIEVLEPKELGDTPDPKVFILIR